MYAQAELDRKVKQEVLQLVQSSQSAHDLELAEDLKKISSHKFGITLGRGSLTSWRS